MPDRIASLFLAKGQDWSASFQEAAVDFVPDPMMLRAAELFLLGQDRAAEAGAVGGPDEVWGVVDRNMDGVLAFFHVLMTRDRIPLIDYETTFPSHHFSEILGDVVVPVHVDHGVYTAVKQEAQDKVRDRREDLRALPPAMIADIARELGTSGYEWYPDPGLDLPGDQRVAATFLLGGIIFGGYAQAAGVDHILQSKRSRLFAALTVPQAEDPLWGFRKEQELFRRFQQYIAIDDRLRADEFELPPSVVPHLLLQDPPPRTPGELLERALALRESPAGRAYREWHRRLRHAWSLGRHDDAAERAVVEVLRELKKRFPHGQADEDDRPILAMKVDIGLEAEAKVGGEPWPAEAKLGGKVEAKDIRVGIPNRLRNWVVDRLPFQRHKKLLLRLSLDQRKYDNLMRHLRQLWQSHRH